MNLNKEELMFYKHLTESAYSAYYNGIRMYTDFLNLNEISIFNASLHEIPDIAYSMWGGTKACERIVICFHGDLVMKKTEINDIEILRPAMYPITCINIKPTDYKFSELLNHRDYLGAVLNLGISRSKIGDILIEEKEAYIFCNDLMADFIINNLVKVSNTNVNAAICDISGIDILKKHEVITGSVSSIRLDSILKTAFHVSRSSLLPFISSGKVFVNGREVVSNSLVIKEGDIISVRGLGKFKYIGQTGISKKGKINITIQKYA